MSEIQLAAAEVSTADRQVATEKIRAVSRRVVWFCLALYFLAVLDRGALSFAALQMNKELGLTSAMFGISVGIMFGTYSLFEVPSNLVLARFGARVTLTRIAILWGFATILLAFTQGPLTLYLFRGLLGFAGSGLFPGIMLLFSIWIPFAYRARYNASLNYAAPVSYIVASLISGAILQLDGALGLAGWKWLFILEGVPSVLLGIVGIWLITDRPSEATWLDAPQKAWLQAQVEKDSREKTAIDEPGVLKTLRQPIVLLFSVINFGLFCGVSTLIPWLPQVARSVGVPTAQIGIVTAIPAVAALIGMALLSRYSDKTGERFHHAAANLMLGAGGYAIVAFATTPAVMLAGYIVAFVGCFATQAIFWTIPQSYFSRGSAPGAIGLIGTVGSLGGLIIPMVVGRLKDETGSYAGGLLLVSGLMLFSALLTLAVRPYLLRTARAMRAAEAGARPR